MESVREVHEQKYLDRREQLLKAMVTKQILWLLAEDPSLFGRFQDWLRRIAPHAVRSPEISPLIEDALQKIDNGDDPSQICRVIVLIMQERSPHVRRILKASEEQAGRKYLH